MSRMVRLMSLAVAYLAVAVATGQVTSIYDIQYTTDASGDSPKDGSTVTISGIVTAEFWGSYNNRQFFVQDSAGAWSGVMVYNNDGWDVFDFEGSDGSVVHSLAEGDSVTIAGTVDEYYGKTEITDVTSVKIHGKGTMFEPIAVSPGDVAQNAESYEGVLIKVLCEAVSNPDLGHGEWSVTDGTDTLRVDDLWDYYYYPTAGDSLVSVTGCLDYSYGDFKVQPRLARDVVEKGFVRIQRIQQVLYSDLLEAGSDEESDISYMFGDTVTIEGIVTMPTGLSFAGPGVKFIYEDENGGPWSAILSYDPDSTAFPVLHEGDKVRATGYVSEYSTGPSNMTEFWITQPIDIRELGVDTPPVETVNTGDLRWPTEAEQWGTVMVNVKQATVVANDLPYGEWAVDDGSGSVNIDDDSDSISVWQEENGRPPVGTLVDSIRGWVYHHYGSYSDSTAYKLEPLYASDIVISGGPPVIKDYSRDPCVPKPDSAVTVTCDISDNSGIDSAVIKYSVDGAAYQSVSMTNTSGTTWEGTIPVTTTDGAWVNYFIMATDDGGGQNEAMTSTLPGDTTTLQFSYVTRTGDLDIYDIQYTPWSAGDSPFQGCDVSVSGIVTADTTQKNSSYGAFALQDQGGPWHGVLFDYDGTTDVTRGDSITIKGLVEDYNPDWHFKYDNNTMILATEVTVHSSGHSITPMLVKTADLAQTADEVESFEGCLVTVEDPEVSSINQYDWSIWDDTQIACLMDDDMATDAADSLLGTLEKWYKLDFVQGIFNFSFGSYKIQVRDLADLGEVSAGVEKDVQPYAYKLYPSFPNPFNPETRIRFEIPERQRVDVVIYNIRGFKVRTLMKGTLNPGFHVLNWDGRNDHGRLVSSGVYIYRVKAGDFIDHKKMTLIR